VICTDVLGSAFTASAAGGIVAISGTGSACMRVTLAPEGTGVDTRRVGGWGHAIGDEGSAYWVATRCIEETFRGMDGRRAGHGLGLEG
jgi:N-acetylglucosamine kinase